MSSSPTPETVAPPPDPHHAAPGEPTEAGKFSLSEDWLAVVVGLALLVAALTGLIPEGLLP
ncbi:MAG TPA: hypothetical protein PKE40_09210 [Arachnia sp.]|nr:hypothetical protein [Arachnia sp.]HMT86517.1 hypothetical protein [Arachnia sp.]